MFLLLISPLRKKRALHFLAIKMQNNAAGRLLYISGPPPPGESDTEAR